MGAALPIISLVATVAGAVFGAVGQVQQGRAAEDRAAHNAAVARNNAIIARQQAVDAEAIGGVKSAQEQLKARQLAGLQRASLAGQGVALDDDPESSANQLIFDVFGQGRINAANQRTIAEREALGFRRQAANFEAQAGATIAEGSNTASALNLAATGTLLSGASSVASKWLDYKDQGVFS